MPKDFQQRTEKLFSFLSSNGFKLIKQFTDEESFGNHVVVFKSKKLLVSYGTDRDYYEIYIAPSNHKNEQIDLLRVANFLKLYDKNGFIESSPYNYDYWNYIVSIFIVHFDLIASFFEIPFYHSNLEKLELFEDQKN